MMLRYRKTFETHRDKIALLDVTGNLAEPRTFSYRDLDDLAGRAARRLQSAGADTGERIAVHLSNSAECAILFLACLHGGFTIVPLHDGLPYSTARKLIDTISPAVLIHSQDDEKWTEEDSTLNAVSAESLFCNLDSQPMAPFAGNLDDQLSVTFTSATTGEAKGVRHTAGNLIGNAEMFNDCMGFGPDTRMLHVMPMSYSAGLLNALLMPLLTGGIVVMAPQFNLTNAFGLWKTMVEHDINTAWLAPSALAFLLRFGREDWIRDWCRAATRRFCIGFAPLSKTLKTQFQESFGIELYESYGLTETLILSSNSPNDPSPAGSVGKPLDGVAIEIRDTDGGPCAPSEEGEIWACSPCFYSGYLAVESDENDNAPSREGWMGTGDIGYLDRGGNLFISGRIKDLIICGGTNISAQAIEELLMSHPAIRETAVVGLPHDFWGEEPAAFLALEEGYTLEDIKQILLELCKERLLPVEIPKRFIEIDQLPLSVSGKVNKRELRVKFMDGLL